MTRAPTATTKKAWINYQNHVFEDKGELWKLQGQNEIPERFLSWTREKPAEPLAVAQDWHYKLKAKRTLNTQLFTEF